MAFRKLPVRAKTRDMVDTFLGYDHNLRIPEGAFYEMKNLSSDKYPMLSPRPGRATALNIMGDTTGIIMKDKLCFTCGTAFYHGDTRIEMGLSDERKQLVSMGAYVIILPDKKYINTADHADRGDIEAEYQTVDSVRFWICRPDGESYTTEWVTDTEPEAPKDKAVWVNTSEYPNTILQWNEAAKCWVKITAPCVKIFSMGIGKHFKAGDGITISGIKAAESIVDEETDAEITEQQREQLEALEGSAVILECGEDEIVISGVLDAHCVIPTVITVKRSLPIMDYVVEHGNRLWGCRYGLDAGGEFVNILYASKLGDFKNWAVYRGIGTDAYFANVGTDGPFTGAISYGYGSCVLFFKEQGIHAVYGDGPGSFQVEHTACKGVQKGSAGSLTCVDGVVYYKSVTGVCRYTGSLPEEIGEVFGNVQYRDACGGSYRRKYYLSMADEDGVYHLFAYDTRLGLWHREDNTQVVGWADCGDDAWMLLPGGSRYSVTGKGGARELKVKWSAQTGKLGIEHPDRKRLSRINVRVRLDTGSRFRLYIRYDSAGGWAQVCSMTSKALRAYDFPVRIRRCDHWELKLEGEGDCEVYAVVKTYETGSDRR